MLNIRIKQIAYLFIILIISCSCPNYRTCVKDDNVYCVTTDSIYVIDWDSFYRRGLSCMEGKCWERAIEEFREAIKFMPEEMRDARPYGMHFIDYFPNREMGICYFYLGMYGEAIDKLIESIAQVESARAIYFLNQSRKSLIMEANSDIIPPAIELFNIVSFTKENPFVLKGNVKDDQYVTSIKINDELLLTELAQPGFPIDYPIRLKEGVNIITIRAEDISAKATERTINVILDQQGPDVMLNPQDDILKTYKILLTGVIHDTSGVKSLLLDEREILYDGTEKMIKIEELIDITPAKKGITFQVVDILGNTTSGEIPLNYEQRAPRVASRLASNGLEPGILMANNDEKDITFDIKTVPHEKIYYDEIPLGGKIECLRGIEKVTLKVEILEEGETEPQKDIDEIMDDEYKGLKKVFYFNRNKPISIERGKIDLTLTVIDSSGQEDHWGCSFKKVPLPEVLKSYERMKVAILPFAPNIGFSLNEFYKERIITEFIEFIKDQKRFDLIPKDKLHMEEINSQLKKTPDLSEDFTRDVCLDTGAEGVICGLILKYSEGIGVRAKFRPFEKVKDEPRIIDAFIPYAEKEKMIEEINKGSSMLGLKFLYAFPLCEGNIKAINRRSIVTNIGANARIFPGMRYNVFEEENLEYLIATASIKEVYDKASRAQISERLQGRDVQAGYKVRTR